MRNIIIGILLTALLLITAASAAPGDEDEELAIAGIEEFGGSSVAPMCDPIKYTYKYTMNCDTNRVCVIAYGTGYIYAYNANDEMIQPYKSINNGKNVCLTSMDDSIARIEIITDSGITPETPVPSCNRKFTMECETNEVCIAVKRDRAFSVGYIHAYDTNGNPVGLGEFTNLNNLIETCVISNTAPIASIKVVGASEVGSPTYDCVTPGPGPTPEIPEFPTIALPVAAILGLAFVFMRRKN
ncbi:PEF-CTERM sorting domain-containing protein [Methanomethylovorans sp.]|uniref:PEF-CTERM sorting domain-containing protein n=1 Tax=Methanomethylovorans sp. TaxID=2758717 RepID=UPI00345ED201